MAELQGSNPSIFESLRRNPLLQAISIGMLALILQIPVFFIDGLVGERERTRGSAIAEITSKWGKAQQVFGPFLVIPYRQLREEKLEDGKTRVREFMAHATFLPRDLTIDGDLETEVRYRGIFEAPVYRTKVTLAGSFARPDFSSWAVPDEDIFWDRAQLIIEVTDPRAIQNPAQVRWGETAIAFEPGTGQRRAERSGIHAPLTGHMDGASFAFSTQLDLNGSVFLHFAPLGRNTQVRLAGDWPDPSFQGNWLPVEREVNDAGFSARWNIPYLGRNYPQSWLAGVNDKPITASQFGVDLITPVDAYRMAERSLKYELLFLGLTFVMVWMFEILLGLRLHLIQYALIGAALCMFYLLELSLAEHLGFGVAYALAAASVIALVTFYGFAALGSARRGATVGAVLTGLYACLYMLIQLVEYALLVGSIGLFLTLAVIMYLTRHVDWGRPLAAAPNAQAPGSSAATDRS